MNEDSSKNKSFRPVYRPPLPPSSTTVSTWRKGLPFPTAKAIFWIIFWFWFSGCITYFGMRILEWRQQDLYPAGTRMILDALSEALGVGLGLILLGIVIVSPLVLLLKNRPFWWKESITCTLLTLAIALILGVPFIRDYTTYDQRRDTFYKDAHERGAIVTSYAARPDLIAKLAEIVAASAAIGITTGAMASRFYRANHPSHVAPEA